MPMTKVPMKSNPYSLHRRFVVSYCAVASGPLTFAMGEKNRCAPLGSQSTHRSSSTLGIPCSVLDRVRNTLPTGVSSGSMNFIPGMREKASLMTESSIALIGGGPYTAP